MNASHSDAPHGPPLLRAGPDKLLACSLSPVLHSGAGKQHMTSTLPAGPPIDVQNLTCWFGKTRALNAVTLQVPCGGVFGLVGRNGAGKTTLIKHILGLYRSPSGTVRVLGTSPAADPVRVLSRIGYLSEFLDLPLWMRVDELLRYSRAFYPGWDAGYAEDLRRQLDLDPGARLKTLSKGQQAKAGLLVALAFRPELLVLDEPSSGLDPVARRDILETILRSAGQEGRTVFFSSHLLDEVERIADRVAMIHQGSIALCGQLADVLQSHSRWKVRFASAPAAAPSIDGALQVTGTGQEWEVACAGPAEAVAAALAGIGATVVERRPMSLDEIFLAKIGPGEL